jgi:peptidoglycan-N-acetylglucosamine deacetylase
MNSPITTGIYAAVGLAAAAGLAYGGFAYASKWPGSRIFGEALVAPKRPDELALTFDDGPNRKWTPCLLDTLADHGVRATFFLIGQRANLQPDLVRRIVAAGHLIGNHSWDHPNLARCSQDQIREELSRTNETLQQITGMPVQFFRPPFGARRPIVFRIAREMGLRPVLWNAMTSDWDELSSARIASELIGDIDRQRQRGYAANIVLHDGGHLLEAAHRGPSVLAASKIVARYKDACRFVTLDAWV